MEPPPVTLTCRSSVSSSSAGQMSAPPGAKGHLPLEKLRSTFAIDPEHLDEPGFGKDRAASSYLSVRRRLRAPAPTALAPPTAGGQRTPEPSAGVVFATADGKARPSLRRLTAVSRPHAQNMLAGVMEVNHGKEVIAALHADGDGHCLVHSLSRCIVGQEVGTATGPLAVRTPGRPAASAHTVPTVPPFPPSPCCLPPRGGLARTARCTGMPCGRASTTG